MYSSIVLLFMRLRLAEVETSHPSSTPLRQSVQTMVAKSSNENKNKKQASISSKSMTKGAKNATSSSRTESENDNANTSSSKRRKVGMACIYCRRSHMTCDEGRPCKRCIKRDIGHLCHDETTNRTSSSSAVRRGSSNSNMSNSSPQRSSAAPDAHQKSSSTSSMDTTNTRTLPPSAIVNVLGGRTSGVDSMLRGGGNGTFNETGLGMHPSMTGQIPQQNNLKSAMQFPLQGNFMNNNLVPPATTPSWAASMLGGASFLGLGGGDLAGAGNGYSANGDAAGGNEYNILSEFLESLDGTSTSTPLMISNPANNGQSGSTGIDTGLGSLNGASNSNLPVGQVSSEEGQSILTESGTGSKANQALHRNRDRRASLVDTSGLLATGNKADTFFLTAADQKDGTRDERLGKVIQAKLDAGLLRPYNHVNGYARLNRWMEQNCTQASRRRILKPLSIFRPAFRAVAQRLTNVDLIFIEEAFERLLLDYDRVFSTQGIPACLWRRTGEIYKGNKEFADLVGVNFDELREGRCTIYELMQEESAVNYWEKYGAVCFDPGQKAVLTSCILRTNSQKKRTRSGTLSAPLSGMATPNTTAMNRTSSAIENNQGLSEKDVKLTVAMKKKTRKAKENIDETSSADNGKKDVDVSANGEKGVNQTSEENERSDSQDEYLSCCFSFTIRRDAWGIPYAIVGNFLPLSR